MTLIHPVILCGGSGTRLWPLSRRSMPKQFLNLTGEHSLFQQAALRTSGTDFADPLVITSHDYRFVAAQQLSDIGINSSVIVLEPFAKNTAPAILAAAEKLFDGDPDAIMLVVASDHYIPDQKAFKERVASARPSAEAGKIAIFGIHPDRPETGYGYIETGEELSEADGFSVARFHEKPDQKTAKKMIEQGGHLWNSAIFLMQCETVLTLAQKHVPEMLKWVKRSVKLGESDFDFLRLDDKSWAEIEANSIDYAILEKADNLAVFCFLGRWSDLGDWQAVMRELSADGHSDAKENLLVGNASQIDSQSCLIWSEDPGQVVTTVGLKDMVVVAMTDAVLVTNVSQTQNLRELVDSLKRQRYSQADQQKRHFRPWGWFETLILAETYEVRRVHLNPNSQISVQTDRGRSEKWVVINGIAEVRIADGLIKLTRNESIDILPNTTHQLINNEVLPLTLIEFKTGEHLRDNNLEREIIS